MTVLIVTHSEENESADMVTRALAELDTPAFRFDTDRFPTEVRLSAGFGGEPGEGALISAAGELPLAEVDAIWWRRVRIGQQIPTTLDAQMREASIGESRATVLGTLASLPVFCLDPWTRIRQAEMKPLQLRVAHEIGLTTPRTLMTNDPDAARDFVRACPRGAVTKMLSSFAILSGGRESVVFTNDVRPEDLDELDGLSLCPMTFQERIEKALELRVTAVGRELFAAAVDSNALPGAAVDWRRRGVELADAWRPYDLPHDVAEKIHALMDRLHLNYGAFDLILTPRGEWVFLEVNPAGEFFWLELDPGLPISRAIAAILAGKAPRRENRGSV